MIILKFLLLLLLLGLLMLVFSMLTVWRQVKNGFRQFRNQTGTRQTQVDGNVVIDRRSREQADKKIIPRNEGEYVDFTEEGL